MNKKEKLTYAISNADGWVVQNLKHKHNSVFPSGLIKSQDDIRVWEKMLSCIVGTSVSIRRTEGGYICET